MLTSLSSWASMADVGHVFMDWLMPVLLLMGGIAIALGLAGFVLRRMGGRGSVQVGSGRVTAEGGRMTAARLGMGSGRIMPRVDERKLSKTIWDKAAEVNANREADALDREEAEAAIRVDMGV